jgi:hypothetical protein
MTNDHGPAGAMEDISGWPDYNPSTALLLTGPDGVVRRVVLATNVLPEEASQGLIGATVLNVFAREERAFLQSLLDKARDARYFDAGAVGRRGRSADVPLHLAGYREISRPVLAGLALVNPRAPSGAGHERQ